MTELDFIRQTFEETQELLARHYRNRGTLKITAKTSINDLVTEADLAVQQALVERIQAQFPGDRIVAEETGYNRIPEGSVPRAWVIDPIDGTMNFVRGQFPIFGISLAFAQDGQPSAGGVAFPMTGEVFFAARGEGSYRNGARLRVSTVDTVAASRGDVDFAGPEDRAATVARYGRVIQQLGQLRCHGAAVAGLCAIAAGEAEAYVHVTLSPWDYAAGQLLVEEAGGRATRPDGRPLRLFDGGQGVVVSNGAIHEELLKLVD